MGKWRMPFRKPCKGAASAEHIIIACLIAIACLLAVRVFGKQVGALWLTAEAILSGKSDSVSVASLDPDAFPGTSSSDSERMSDTSSITSMLDKALLALDSSDTAVPLFGGWEMYGDPKYIELTYFYTKGGKYQAYQVMKDGMYSWIFRNTDTGEWMLPPLSGQVADPGTSLDWDTYTTACKVATAKLIIDSASSAADYQSLGDNAKTYLEMFSGMGRLGELSDIIFKAAGVIGGCYIPSAQSGGGVKNYLLNVLNGPDTFTKGQQLTLEMMGFLGSEVLEGDDKLVYGASSNLVPGLFISSPEGSLLSSLGLTMEAMSKDKEETIALARSGLVSRLNGGMSSAYSAASTVANWKGQEDVPIDDVTALNFYYSFSELVKLPTMMEAGKAFESGNIVDFASAHIAGPLVDGAVGVDPAKVYGAISGYDNQLAQIEQAKRSITQMDEQDMALAQLDASYSAAMYSFIDDVRQVK